MSLVYLIFDSFFLLCSIFLLVWTKLILDNFGYETGATFGRFMKHKRDIGNVHVLRRCEVVKINDTLTTPQISFQITNDLEFGTSATHVKNEDVERTL